MRARRGRGEEGIAVILSVLLLVPLLTFAAFGVDLASWHVRISQLQQAVDAAALAGTVWMPNLPKARAVAAATLAENDIVDGQDDMVVQITEGASPTSLRVVAIDNSPAQYFSQVFQGPQPLQRYAEADYFLPLPLGSPLNYFGGDRTKTGVADVTTYSLTWPVPHDSTARPPAGPFGCNVGTLLAQGLGRWSSATTYSATGFSGSVQCRWTAALATTSAADTTQVPSNVPCNRQQAPVSALGRWNTGVLGLLHTYTAGNRHLSGTGNRQCTWAVPGTQPPDAASNPPLNAPCNVTGELLAGSWSTLVGLPLYLPVALLPASLCQWPASITTTVIPGVNPIDVDQSPGFWAQIEGPGTVAAYGDAFSTRCTTALNCSTVQSNQWRDEGYWYAVEIPAGGTGAITLSVFDAAFRRDGDITAGSGDFNLGAASTTTNPDFATEFRVYRQTNPLDVNQRVPVLPTAVPDQVDGSCWWSVTTQDAFDLQWRPLCTLYGDPEERFLVNVRTRAPGAVHGAGLNGYALKAIAVGSAQPALYAYSDMGMFNNGSGTFYLAEVAPHFAGKVLAVDLWDPGDVSTGTATLYPKMPSLEVVRPTQDVPATCTYTSSPDPNAVNTTGGAWGGTGVRYTTAHASDHTQRCAIDTALTGTPRRFNDEWLHLRIQIPTDYTCTVGLNPETTPGSCWWGITYDFSSQPYDVTTWKARIEGNPVHLTR